MKRKSNPTTSLSCVLKETGKCTVMGQKQCARRDLTCFVHTRMLYLTCSLGTFEDGNMCNLQRVNQDFDGRN
jgi:hypothetical protein